MQLTPEQLAKCRADFEADWKKLASCGVSTAKNTAWLLYQAAWRPITSVEEMWSVFFKAVEFAKMDVVTLQRLPEGTDFSLYLSKYGVRAIHRAFGGEE